MTEEKDTVGWREWVSLPMLNLPWIKAKVDTGARTSALHVSAIEEFEREGQLWIRFVMHPLQRQSQPQVASEAAVKDRRTVTSSGGHRQNRYVIDTWLKAGDRQWLIELTLTSRPTMNFRMLLGRTALASRLVVDPSRSYLLGQPDRQELGRYLQEG